MKSSKIVTLLSSHQLIKFELMSKFYELNPCEFEGITFLLSDVITAIILSIHAVKVWTELLPPSLFDVQVW